MIEPSSQKSLQALRQTLQRLETLSSSEEAQSAVKQANDYTEMLAVEMEKLSEAVLTANQAKAKFVSVVTHELRLPLTSIRGYTDLIRQGIIGPVNEQQLNFLNVIRNNVERMTALISDLSDISHIESGRIKIQPQAFSCDSQIMETLRAWQPKFEEKQQTIEVDVAANLPLIHSDPARFKQVLGYLLSNSWKYTLSGGKIIIRVRQEGNAIRFEVSDTGIGIKPEDQAQLFTPFFRSEDEAVREHPGWGLALHLARLLVALMGGSMGVQSEYRKGSTFWFMLPVEPG